MNIPQLLLEEILLGEKKAEDYRKQQVHNNTQRIEQALDEAMDKLLNTPVEQIVYPENVQVEEKGFSK